MLTPWPLQPLPIKVFVALCVALEMVALAGALAGWGSQARDVLVVFGGFWPDLLGPARPAYGAQPVLMFATCVFLHGGPMHLFMNMVGLLWLGPLVVRRTRAAAFWPIAGVSALAAGGLFALMATSGAPMVGASGVLFGFLGTVVAWHVLDMRARGEALVSLLPQAAFFIALNVALTLVSPAGIAWQAHLGGFLGGALCGSLTWGRPALRRRS
ncbi:MAG: rhomboid family intramembrane serine protease [Pseudomonadota bacterium]